MSGLSLRPRRVLPKKPGEPGSREWAEVLLSATVGYPRYLNGPEGFLYWSPFKDSDERDGGPEGAPLYATPMAALSAHIAGIGMIRLPEGWEIAAEVSG
jgi:hypothetical protein